MKKREREREREDVVQRFRVIDCTRRDKRAEAASRRRVRSLALVELENRSRDISVSAEAGTEGTGTPGGDTSGHRARANKSDRTHRAGEMETRFGPRDQRTRYKLKQISRVILINPQPRINNSLPISSSTSAIIILSYPPAFRRFAFVRKQIYIYIYILRIFVKINKE